MRKVATELDVVPMSIYTYFANKRELVEAIVDRVAGDIELPDTEGLDWREGMAELARSIRSHLMAHPGTAALVLSQPTLRPNALGLGEYSYSLMQAAGFHDQAMVDGFYCVFVFVLGFIALEIPRTASAAGVGFEEELEAVFAGLPADRFPHSRAARPPAVADRLGRTVRSGPRRDPLRHREQIMSNVARPRELATALRSPTGMLGALLVLAPLVLAVVGPVIWGDEAKRIDVPHVVASARHRQPRSKPTRQDLGGHSLVAVACGPRHPRRCRHRCPLGASSCPQ